MRVCLAPSLPSPRCATEDCADGPVLLFPLPAFVDPNLIHLQSHLLGHPSRCAWHAQDKEKVAQYKASIKDQLSRMGLIRGQPRQPWHSTGLTNPQVPTPGVAGPGPQTSLRRSMSARETYRREAAPYMTNGSYRVAGLSGSSIPGKPPAPVITRVRNASELPAREACPTSCPRPRPRSWLHISSPP